MFDSIGVVLQVVFSPCTTPSTAEGSLVRQPTNRGSTPDCSMLSTTVSRPALGPQREAKHCIRLRTETSLHDFGFVSRTNVQSYLRRWKHTEQNTLIQAGMLRVRFPTRSLYFPTDLILPTALWPWGRFGLKQK
jgi:hypothetical protein